MENPDHVFRKLWGLVTDERNLRIAVARPETGAAVRRQLEEVEPSLADERAKWERAANLRERGLAVWGRDELDAAADRTIAERSAIRTRSKSKP